MRILFLTERFPPDIGGVARSAARLVESLTALGTTVDVLSWSRSLQPGAVEQSVLLTGGRRYRVGAYRQWDMTFLKTQAVLDWLQQTAGSDGDAQGYDLVWGHYLFPAGFLAVWFGGMHGVRRVVSARGNDVDREMYPPGNFARLQWTLSQADLVTTVSEDIARKVQLLAPQATTQVIRNAVDTGLFRPGLLAEGEREALRRSLNIQPDEIVLGFSGELREKKGQGYLLEALTQVRRQRPACLLIIGAVRPTADDPVQMYRQQFPEDGDRIIVTGHLPEPKTVAQHLQLCELFLQPSLWEGMPNALLEAMACELGCIGSDAGGIAEILEHGESGFVLPRFQLDRLGVAVLEWLALDPLVQVEIGQRARQRVVEAFSLAGERSRLQAVLEMVA